MRISDWSSDVCSSDLLVLVALYVSLGRELAPLVAEYRAEVQTRASEALGIPVQIGSLDGSWSALAPILLAHDVMIGEGANALHQIGRAACRERGCQKG